MSSHRLIVATAVLVAVSASASPVAAQGQVHCGQITTNETWARQAGPHQVTCDVVVRNSVLTIEPGALIMMHAGKNLEVQAGGSLQAVGDNTGRIRFRATDDDAPAGTWGQLRFLAGAMPSAMEFVDVNDGGKDGVPMVLIIDSVVVMGTQPTPSDLAKNVRLYNAMASPLTISSNEIGPSLAGAGDQAAGRACNQLAIEESNGVVAIEVMAASEPDVRDGQTWFDFCVPYVIEDVVTVGGPDAPTLEINPGVVIQFGINGGFDAGMDADNLGQLETNGTPEQRIVIAGRFQAPGSWGGINLTDFTFGGHSLSETSIRNGGARGVPMVRVTTGTAIAGALEFAGALAYPLEITADAVQGFLEETWVVGNPRFLNNGVQRVRVVAPDAVDLVRSTTWGDPGVPYEIVGDLVVGRSGEAARFRLLAGTKLLFGADKGLTIGDPQSGAAQFAADGEPGRPVVLSGVDETPGSWSGMVIGDATEFANFVGSEVSFGGTADRAMLRWGNVTGSITSTVLSDAPGYPMSLPLEQLGVLVDDHSASPDRKCSEVDRCGNRLERNRRNHFLVAGATIETSGRLGWHSPGAPVEFAGSLAFIGTSVRLDLYDGLELRFRAGEGLALGQDVTHAATLNFVDNDPASRAVLGAADAEVGWAGATVHEGSSVTGSGGAFDQASADAASLTLDGAAANLHDVAFRDARGVGARVTGANASLELTRGLVTGNRIGVAAADGGWVKLEESTVAGNTEWGVLNEHHAFCIDAVRVYWGRPAGPDDSSTAPDRCMTAGNASPGADKVSDFVDWWPYAVNGGDYTPAGGLGPNPKRIYMPALVRQAALGG